MEHIRIEQAVPEDIPFLAECRFGMFQEMHPETDFRDRKNSFIEKSSAYFHSTCEDPALYRVCARSAAGPVGCGIIMFHKRPPHINNFDNLFGYVLNIFVVHEYRRRGVATQLMEALKEEAVRRGVQRIGLNASDAGTALYRKLGYESKPAYMELKW